MCHFNFTHISQSHFVVCILCQTQCFDNSTAGPAWCCNDQGPKIVQAKHWLWSTTRWLGVPLSFLFFYIFSLASGLMHRVHLSSKNKLWHSPRFWRKTYLQKKVFRITTLPCQFAYVWWFKCWLWILLSMLIFCVNRGSISPGDTLKGLWLIRLHTGWKTSKEAYE